MNRNPCKETLSKPQSQRPAPTYSKGSIFLFQKDWCWRKGCQTHLGLVFVSACPHTAQSREPPVTGEETAGGNVRPLTRDRQQSPQLSPRCPQVLLRCLHSQGRRGGQGWSGQGPGPDGRVGRKTQPENLRCPSQGVVLTPLGRLLSSRHAPT